MGTGDDGIKSFNRTTQRSVFALLCAIALFPAVSVTAGTLEDFTKSVTRSVSDAASKGVDSVTQGVSSAIGGNSTPPDPGQVVPQSTVQPPALFGLPVNTPGSTECLSVRPDGEKAWLTNTCADKILVLLQPKPGPIKCLKFEVAPQKSNRVLYGNGIVRAVCHSGVDIRAGECKCAHG